MTFNLSGGTMSRLRRQFGIGVVGIVLAAWGCNGGGDEGGGGKLANDVASLKQRVDSLEKEKQRLRTYFDSTKAEDVSAWAYWRRLERAICNLEGKVPGLPPGYPRVCEPGVPPDKLPPPPYPPK
jgi:hypothetical protein